MDAPGQGAIDFARVGSRTVVERVRAHSPLRLVSPRTSTNAQWTYATTFGGGLVDGDEVRIVARVREGATALLTTQGTTKVYRGEARSIVEADVERDALLAIVGDPIACFAGARFHQSIDVRLVAGASLVLLDALSCGRAARGERWAFDLYESRITIHRENKPILVDPIRLDPRDGAIADRMRGVDAMATLVLAGPMIIDHARAIVASIDAERARMGAPIEAANAIDAETILLRIAAPTIHALLERIRTRLAFLPSLLGDDPWGRKY